MKDVDSGSEAIIMWISWRNEGFGSDSVVENYVQWEDPEKEGEFIGMTCQKNRQDNGFLDIIDNFVGPA